MGIYTNIITALVFFIVGVVSGYMSHDFLRQTLNMDKDMSKNFILIVVTCIWGISMIVSVVNPSYSVPYPVHALMGAIVGFFFYRR